MATYSPFKAPTAASSFRAGVAVKSDRTLRTWGAGIADQGFGVDPGFTGVLSVAASHGYALALFEDGTVQGWGSVPPSYDNGQLNIPPGLSDVVMVAAGRFHCAAVKSDGTVVAWGATDPSNVPAGLTNVIEVACGFDVTWALKSDGTVAEWGGYTQYPIPVGISNIKQISGCDKHCVALRNDGTVTGWSRDNYGNANIPPGLENIIMVAGGSGWSLFLHSDGTVTSSGSDPGGFSPPVGLNNVEAVYAGRHTSLAIQSDGKIIGWGLNDYNQSNPSAFIDVMLPATPISSLDVQISAVVPVVFGGMVTVDWASMIDPIVAQEIYTLELTGSEDGLDDITIPISSWQATNRAAPRQSYVQAVVPASGPYISEIESRSNGDLVIKQGYRFSDGTTKTEEIARSRLNSVRYDRGPERVTLTLSGRKEGLQAYNGTRVLQEVRSISMTNGRHRVRCKVDLFLRPGMQAVANGKAFTVSYINYYANGTDRFCEVSDE